MQTLDFRIYGKRELEGLKEGWQSMECGADMTFFQSCEWNEMLVRQFERQWKRRFYRKIIYACVFDDGKLRLLAPLRVKRLVKGKKIIREIELLGADSFSDYVNLIYDSGSSECGESRMSVYFDCLLQGLKENWGGYTLNWNSIPKRSDFGKYLIERYDDVSVFYKTVAIPVGRFENFEDYFASLSKSTRQNYRTACNRMTRDRLKYEWKMYDGRLDSKLIDTLMEINLERSIKKNAEKFSSKRSIAKEKYAMKHNSIVRDMMSRMDSCWTLVSCIDGKAAGFLTGAKKNGVVYVVMNKVKPEYEFYSPMIVAIVQLAKEVIEEGGVNVLDFGRGTEEYKYRLGGEENDLLEFRHVL